MIVYRKGSALRLLRHTAPDPPFWAAGTVLPYSPKRTTPLAIDWVNLIATGSESETIEIADAPGETIARSPYLRSPLLVDATGPGELIYRRGEEASRAAVESGLTLLELITTDGVIPDIRNDRFTLAIAAWPPREDALDELAAEASARGIRFGVVIPVIPPETTDLALLAALAAVAARNGARFLAAVPIDLEPTARHALAAARELDDEAFAALFESDLELLTVATERHIAALARENGMDDLVRLDLGKPSNWSAASELASTANRMIRMDRDVELGWEILRASRTVAALGKPLERIANAASLSIIEPIEPMIAGALEQWLERGTSDLMDDVDRAWRLRRDYGVA
ncbi:MAG TPA: hypothetical protein VLV48_04655 [Thermoanaerobaculia bacterium]|nr:hypothetical protein [Thermoanaerobaculia bacterium]